MASVEERLAKVEKEVEQLRVRQNRWPIAEIDEQYKNDSILEEIFRLADDEENKSGNSSKE